MTFVERQDRIDWLVKFTDFNRKHFNSMSDEELSNAFKKYVVKRNK